MLSSSSSSNQILPIKEAIKPWTHKSGKFKCFLCLKEEYDNIYCENCILVRSLTISKEIYELLENTFISASMLFRVNPSNFDIFLLEYLSNVNIEYKNSEETNQDTEKYRKSLFKFCHKNGNKAYINILICFAVKNYVDLEYASYAIRKCHFCGNNMSLEKRFETNDFSRFCNKCKVHEANKQFYGKCFYMKHELNLNFRVHEHTVYNKGHTCKICICHNSCDNKTDTEEHMANQALKIFGYFSYKSLHVSYFDIRRDTTLECLAEDIEINKNMFFRTRLELCSVFEDFVSKRQLVEDENDAKSRSACGGGGGSSTISRKVGGGSKSSKEVEEPKKEKPIPEPELCSICMVNLPDYALVHGNTAHQCVCEDCSKLLIQNGELCPLCRMPITCAVKIFK